MADVVIETSPHEAPDWTIIAHEPACPFCSYNVRGLIEPRCPECGRRFMWWEVLDPTRATHPYLFEQKTEQPVRSFFKTAAMTNFPAHFWKNLSPAQEPRVWRLMLYAICVVGLILFPLVSLGMRQLHAALALPRSWQPSFRTPWAEAAGQYSFYGERGNMLFAIPIGSILGGSSTLMGLVLMSGAFAIEWMLASFGAILIFQQSLGRSGMKAAHVARVAVYCVDFAIWPAMLLSIGLIIQPFFDEMNNTLPSIMSVAGIAALLYWPIAVYRLMYAFRYYLRIDRPMVTVLLMQLVVAALLLAALTLLNEFFLHFS